MADLAPLVVDDASAAEPAAARRRLGSPFDARDHGQSAATMAVPTEVYYILILMYGLATSRVQQAHPHFKQRNGTWPVRPLRAYAAQGLVTAATARCPYLCRH